MPDVATSWGAWAPGVRDDPFPRFAAARERCPVQQVRLGDGHDAWVVLGYDAARQALNDPRLSKDMVAALDGDPGVVAEGLPGPAFSRHMLYVDPPDLLLAVDRDELTWTHGDGLVLRGLTSLPVHLGPDRPGRS